MSSICCDHSTEPPEAPLNSDVSCVSFKTSPTVPIILLTLAIADNYFSMFGYKVCRLKVPNIGTRPAWNFVKCSTVTVMGAIPADAEELISSVLKKGVTFWKTSFGNYTANNK